MLLNQRQRSNKQIVACSYQVNIESRMISDQTVDSFIISNCIPGSKFYNYLSISVSLEGAFSVIEQKDVVGISKKLEIRFQL